MMVFGVAGVLGLAFGGATRAVHAEGLVEEPANEAATQAERDYRSALRASKAGSNEKALALFEKALPWKRESSDIFYNLVQVASLLKAHDKVALYGQAFMRLEQGTKDADAIAKMVAAAWTTLAARGRAAAELTLQIPDGAVVMIGGVPLGDAAHTHVALPPGTHALRVEKADHLPFEESLAVSAGQAVSRDITLTRIVYRGFVKVLSNPEAGVAVLVDGVKVGETPLAKPLDLEAQKKMLLRFEKPGFDPWVRYIELGKGETLELKPTLEPSPGP